MLIKIARSVFFYKVNSHGMTEMHMNPLKEKLGERFTGKLVKVK